MSAAAPAADVTAVVLVSRGGAPLARTMASLAWTARRLLVDPSGALAAEGWPAGAGAWPADGPAGWVLLLAEGEVASDALASAVAEAVRGTDGAYRVAVECEGFGGAVRLAGRPLRLALRPHRELRVCLGGEISLTADARPRHLSRGAIVGSLAPEPGGAVAALNAETTVLAILAAAAGVRPRCWRLALGGAIGAGRVLFGRARAPLGWGRWITAVFAGYRALLAEAKLWERRELGMAPS